MKLNYYITLIFVWLLSFASCQQEAGFDSNVGYLYLEATTNTSLSTKSTVPENYKPEQLHVEILNTSGTVLYSTDDYDTEWKGKQFALPAGSYTIEAHSHGFDGQASGFNNPYYYGSSKTTVTAGKTISTSVTCTLANVKVSVQFDSEFKKAFRSAEVLIASAVSGITPLKVEMGKDIQPIYIPAGNFTATVTVSNPDFKEYSMDRTIESVQARDHYILKYKVKPQGNGSITVEADASEREYTFNFNVPTKATTELKAKAANAWSNFALLEGEVPSSEGELDPSVMKFEWRNISDSDWQTLSTIFEEETYSAKLTGLIPNTTYTYRMVYAKDGQKFTSNEVAFTTDIQTPLPNGNLDDWYKNDKTIYAVSEADFNAGKRFWDSSNAGTTTGLASIVNKNPTQGNSEIVHTAGGQSAELKTIEAMSVLAAASLYAGTFGSTKSDFSGAELDFGQPWTARPTQFRGFYHYTPVAMNIVGNNLPSSISVTKGVTPDSCAIYIALTTKSYHIDNTNPSTFLHPEDEEVIAYGELPKSEAVSTNGSYKEFVINLTYKDLIRKPTHIIIVCSASKYGDYFTGGVGSTLYLDDLELIYGNDPKTK